MKTILILSSNPKHRLQGYAGWVWCKAISPDETTLASASADFTVKLWNIERGTLLQTFIGHLGEVRSLIFSLSGSTIACNEDEALINA